MKRMNGKILVLLLLSLASTMRADPIVSIQPSLTAVASGGTFALSVNIANTKDLFAFQFDLGFAPGVLSALSITEGSFLSGGGTTTFVPGTIDNAAGTISFTADSLLGAIPGVSGSGIMATIDFTALAIGTSAVNLSNVVLLDSSLSPIVAGTAKGNVNVVPEPSTCLLLRSGLLGFGALRGRKRLSQVFK